MDEKKRNLIWGVFLIAIGVIFLVGNISRVGMELLWPVFLLAAGMAFWVGYFYNRKNVGLLMPGSILVVVGLLFLYCTLFGWWHMEDLWPVFFMAPAAGFLAMYIGGAKEQGLLVPVVILFSLGVIFLFVSTRLGDYWPVLLIVAGLVLVILSRKSSGKGKKPSE